MVYLIHHCRQSVNQLKKFYMKQCQSYPSKYLTYVQSSCQIRSVILLYIFLYLVFFYILFNNIKYKETLFGLLLFNCCFKIWLKPKLLCDISKVSTYSCPGKLHVLLNIIFCFLQYDAWIQLCFNTSSFYTLTDINININENTPSYVMVPGWLCFALAFVVFSRKFMKNLLWRNLNILFIIS